MRIIIGETVTNWGRMEWTAYRGVIGIFYNTTWDGVCAYILLGVIIALSLIGLATVIKWAMFGRKNNEPEDPHKKWMRTGRM